MALLTAQVLRTTGAPVTIAGKHPRSWRSREPLASRRSAATSRRRTLARSTWWSI